MGLFSKQSTGDFTPDIKDHYAELDSKHGLLRVRTGMMKKRIVAVKDIRGYRVTQDDKTLLETMGTPLGLNKDNTLPKLIKINQVEGMGELNEGEIYTLILTLILADGEVSVKFVDTRTPLKSPAYSDAVLDTAKMIALVDPLLAGVNA